MNIGIVTYWFERGAAYVSRQYRQVLAQDHEVFIYARGESYAIGNSTWDHQRVTWGKKPPFLGKTAIDLKDFRHWLVANHIKMVIFNEQHWWPPILLCNELGVITGAYVDFYTEETVPLFACYDFLLCNTRRHHSVFAWHPQCFYIPWGTDLDLFNPPSLEAVEPGKVTFFHSSGMSPQRKGTDFVIKAISELSENSRLVIHSQVPLKSCLPEVADMMQALEAAHRLILYQSTVPAPGLYHLGDIYVYPSRLDGIGLTIAEAMASGLPVIATDCAPMNEFVIPDVNGQLVSVENFVSRADGYYWPQALVSRESLRQKMEYYIANSASIALFKKQARQFAIENLDWRNNARSLQDIVEIIEKQPVETLRKAGSMALAFENQRATLPQKFPTLFYLAHLAYLPVKSLRELVIRLS